MLYSWVSRHLVWSWSYIRGLWSIRFWSWYYIRGLCGIWFEVDVVFVGSKAFGLKLMLYSWASRRLIWSWCYMFVFFIYLLNYVFVCVFGPYVFLFCLCNVFFCMHLLFVAFECCVCRWLVLFVFDVLFVSSISFLIDSCILPVFLPFFFHFLLLVAISVWCSFIHSLSIPSFIYLFC